MKCTLVIALAAIVVSQVQGSVVQARSPLHQLFARQTAVCVTECSTFTNALDVCRTTSCLCTRAVAVSLNTCVNCFYTVSPTPQTLTTTGELIDEFENTCAAFDIPTVSVTVTTAPRPTSSPPLPPFPSGSGSSGPRPTISGTEDEEPTSSRSIRTLSAPTTTPRLGPTTTEEDDTPQITIRPPDGSNPGSVPPGSAASALVASPFVVGTLGLALALLAL
ncbi:hypothetical protein FA15DRAFT_757919 [Coprinopsis marcescibilis]|uniref:Extracellular membrane protein CFEM domain-containing protein n=1 Tax=Coprinopsis marcescibilis TaxID=230819 RepID=A0A5C3KPU4_COPMA|nr:hypothetical protein FA15DRAFT_757919 [Coprinopsis marcescibilis]